MSVKRAKPESRSGAGSKAAGRSGATTGSTAGSSSALSQRPEFVTVCWQPRTQPFLFIGVLLLYVLALFGVYWYSRDWLMTAASLAALLAVSWRLWLPIRFHIGPTGIIQSVLGQQRQLGWGYVRQVQPHRGGVQVIYQSRSDQISLSKSIVISVPSNQQGDLNATFEYYLQDQ